MARASDITSLPATPSNSTPAPVTALAQAPVAPTIPGLVYQVSPTSLLALQGDSGQRLFSGTAARLALRAFAGAAVCQGAAVQSPVLHTRDGPGTVLEATPRVGFGMDVAVRTGLVHVAACQAGTGGGERPLVATAACQGGAQGALQQGAEALAARSAAVAGTSGAAGEAGVAVHGHIGHLNDPLAVPHPHPHHNHSTPPDGALGFAEDASVHEEEEKLKPEPRLTALSITKSLIAGGVAGGVSRTAVAPLERLKILQQVQNAHGGAGQYTGMWQGLRRIWQQEGFNGLFKGNGVNCARIVPNSAVKFLAYEETSQLLLWLARQRTGDPDAELTPLLRLGAGATAGIIAMSATYPMDMVRGRLTVQGEGSSRQYKNMLHAMVTVAREEGPRALYRGWLPSVIGVVPYVGLNFAVYETLKDWLTKHYNQEQRLRIASEGGNPADAAPVELTVVTKLGCGAVAGTLGQTVAYPLDVVRRRLQMVGWKNAAPVLTAEGRIAAGPQYTGMVDAFRKTVQQEGVGALFRGLLPNSVKVVPSIAIAFVTYEIMKDMLKVEIRISD